MYNYVLIWIIAIVVFIIIEIATVGLATIWFAGGATVAFFEALVNWPFYVQLISFIAVSIALLIFTRPLLVKRMNLGKVKTNVDILIGKDGVVLEDIVGFETGLVKINGQIWTAKALHEERIEKGEIIIVDHIEGVKLIVEPDGKKQ